MKTFSSGDVATMCDVTSRTVMRWITAGRLNAFKLPGRGNNRIREDDLISFLKENHIPMPAELSYDIEVRGCLLIANDKHLVRHVKRIARDADFDVMHFQNALQAGYCIAKERPCLIVVDSELSNIEVGELLAQLESMNDYNPQIFIFGSQGVNGNVKKYKGDIRMFHKPMDLNAFALSIEQISSWEN
ncbi:helix-turn-helix domain-containing protein [Glaciecola sp. 1036]|uniref:helix-turn-helix domain-containing protein n=1 Tax=Alteromonadaceae TaxID=72275 RepID=UPI003D00CB38